MKQWGGKVSSLESKIKSKELDLLFKAILELQDIEECYKFFEDVATINEVKALAQRLHYLIYILYLSTIPFTTLIYYSIK